MSLRSCARCPQLLTLDEGELCSTCRQTDRDRLASELATATLPPASKPVGFPSTKPESAQTHPFDTDASTRDNRVFSVDSATRRAAPQHPRFELPGFELFEVIGEGGMGVVYRARDLRLDQPRAIKVIAHRRLFVGRSHDRFYREARAAARLDHPGVIRVLSLGEHEGILFICMELATGGNLKHRLGGGPLPVRAAAELVRGLAWGVQHAHENKVLHRDLKPANIFVFADGTAKIGDFGLAKLLDDVDGLSESGAVMGTPGYMAPEQVEGNETEISERTDVWSLGVILYECLTGRVPFRAQTLSETRQLLRTTDVVPPKSLRNEVPADLEEVCLKCLEKRPSRRYASASELAADLDAWLAGRTTVARQNRRRTTARRAGAVMAVCVVAAAIACLIDSRSSSDSGESPNAKITQAHESDPSRGLFSEPREIHWAGGKNDQWRYDRNTHSLVLSSRELGLAGFGESQADRYRFSVALQQTPWTGHVGLIFGYSESEKDGERITVYQLLELAAVGKSPETGQQFRLEWKTVRQRGRIGGPGESIRVRATSPVFILASGEHRIGVSVGPEGLEAATLDNEPLRGLSASAVTGPPPAAEARGRFGVHVRDGHGVFRDVQYTLPEEQ